MLFKKDSITTIFRANTLNVSQSVSFCLDKFVEKVLLTCFHKTHGKS